MELFTEDRDSGRSMSLRRRAKGDMATGHKDLRMLVVGGIARSRDFGGDSRWERLMMSTLLVRKIFVIRKAHGRSRRGGGMDALYCPLFGSAVHTGSTARDFRFFVFWMGNVEELLFLLINIY
ncbi:uncharacterized protein LOC122032552 isoform X3 [Zingiber officinale]|uniref:uncharacterized protein LOC122032552 isoform X3 n=1 Tax=Zingiber officinale TaxID=94328 RepID=UPI001C4AD3B2|nr:uncharacterized protein LOC122032552 isoform X3 [Zingiber officinale]